MDHEHFAHNKFTLTLPVDKIYSVLTFSIKIASASADQTICIETSMPQLKYTVPYNTYIEIPIMTYKPNCTVSWTIPGDFTISNIKLQSHTKSIHFVTCYSQGHPFDRCMNLSGSHQILTERLKPVVDKIHSYTVQDLRKNPETAHLVNEFPNDSKYNASVHLMGYFKWKPYIILKTLEMVEEGDIVYYRDCNVQKYPGILEGLDDTPQTLEFVLRESDIYVPIENYPMIKAKNHIKRAVFEHFGCFTDEYLEAYLHNASIVVCRKSDTSMKVIREWLENCKDKLVDNKISTHEHKDFKWHTFDQGPINVLLNRYKLSSRYSLIHRQFSVPKLKKCLRIALLVAGEMRNFDHPTVIESNMKYLIAQYNCDLFVSTWTKRGYSLNHGHNSGSTSYSDNHVTREQIAQVYGHYAKDINIQDYQNWLCALDQKYVDMINAGLPQGDKVVLATSYPQFYKIWDALRMCKQYQQLHNFEYDIIIRLRPDLALTEPIPSDILENIQANAIYSMNPPVIHVDSRIYDIFFLGDNSAMSRLCDVYTQFDECLAHPHKSCLNAIDPCRLLYVQALMHDINVIDIPKSIGDVYRDEPALDYANKIKGFNQQQRTNIRFNKFLKNNAAKYNLR